MKLNIGCGETKLEDYINIDIEESIKPDLVLDIRNQTLPYEENSIERITCLHNIEHIEHKYHPYILAEFQRVLIPDEGELILAYPEFEKCVNNFLSNYKGLKDFWRATLYGRQLYPGDYHVTPMITEDLIPLLKDVGFKDIRYISEIDQEFNTFLTCVKGVRPFNHENLLNIEVFNKSF